MKKQGLNNLFYFLNKHWEKHKTKAAKTIKSTYSLCQVQCLQPLALFSQCLWQCCRAPGPEGTPTSSLGAQKEYEKCRFLLQCRFPERSSGIHLIFLCINSLHYKRGLLFHIFLMMFWKCVVKILEDKQPWKNKYDYIYIKVLHSLFLFSFSCLYLWF